MKKKIYKSINMGQGIFPDIPAHDTKIEILTDCRNVRFINNSAHRVGGFTYLHSSTAPINHIFHADFQGTDYIIFSDGDKLYSLSGTSVNTLYTFPTTVSRPTSIYFNDLYIFSSEEISPIYWNFTSSTASALPYLPSDVKFKTVRNFKSCLIGLNATTASAEYPYLVWWTHPADPGSLPSWDYTDPTKLAGRYDLVDDTGDIIDGRVLGNTFYIYKENSIYAMNYIGGAYFFGFSKICDTDGIASVNCIEEVEGNHVVFGRKNIYLFDGNKTVSLVEGKIKKFVFSNISKKAYSKCFVFKNRYFQEIFFCFPAYGADRCNTALVWNYKYNTFYIIDLPDVNHGGFATTPYSVMQWDAIYDTWDDYPYRWDDADEVPFNQRVLFANDSGILLFDTLTTLAGAITYPAYIEKKGISTYEDGEPNFAEKYKLLRYIRPKIHTKNNTKLTFWVGTMNNIHEEPVYKIKKTYTVGRNFNMDCLLSGRYFAIKIISDDLNVWRLDNIDMEFVYEGDW